MPFTKIIIFIICLYKLYSLQYYYGPLCECDNFTCKRHNGKVCSGDDHGVCDCGRCTCHSGWTGDACECAEDINGCIDNNGVLCSNRGTCVCGSCVCNSSRYSGDFCDDCVVSTVFSCLIIIIFKKIYSLYVLKKLYIL